MKKKRKFLIERSPLRRDAGLPWSVTNPRGDACYHSSFQTALNCFENQVWGRRR